MKPKRTDPFTGATRFLETLGSGAYPGKRITTKLEDIIIDTCLPKDTLIWETGIKRKKMKVSG